MQSSHIIPAADKPSATPANTSLHRLADAVVAAAQAETTLTGMMVVLLPLLRALGLAILREVIEDRDRAHDRDRPSLPCREAGCDGQLARTRRVRHTSNHTLLGLLSYERRAYQCVRCQCSAYPPDHGLNLLDGLHRHSQEFASLVVLLTTLLPNAKAMDLFQKCFGFAVSTTLARGLTMAIGKQLVHDERQRAECCWELRIVELEALEPVPAKLRKMKRAKRIYVMLDDSKLGIQEGKRGRGAPKRGSKETKELAALRRVLAEERAKAAKAAKRGKPGPKAPAKVVRDGEDSGYRNVRGMLIFSQADLAGVSKGRAEILRRQVVAHIGTLEEWRKLVHLALHESGAYVAEEVVAIADGGAGIWDLIDELGAGSDLLFSHFRPSGNCLGCAVRPRDPIGGPACQLDIWWLAMEQVIAPGRIAWAVATNAGSISLRIQQITTRRDRDDLRRGWLERPRGGSGACGVDPKREKRRSDPLSLCSLSET